MEVEALMTRAWKAVESAGIPEPLQEMAFRKALEVLLSGDRPRGSTSSNDGHDSTNDQVVATEQVDAERPAAGDDSEDAFFKRLAFESGLPETDLRDVLQLSDGTVHVAPPTKDLGKNTSEQAKTVIALVAGARSKGLSESPVDGTAVRSELTRKSCYQRNNYKSNHLGPLKGFNAGAGREDIIVNSRWLEEFKPAVLKALGRKQDT